MDNSQQRCGFVAILGIPNAGKSTLVNQMTGTKVSIVSPKVQTTRQQILGIAINETSQIILMDTPGIIGQPKRRLERSMVRAAWGASKEADMLLILVDVMQKDFSESHAIIQRLEGRPIILVLNKIDQIKRERLLDITAEFTQHANITDTYMISALNGDGVKDLLNHLSLSVPEGPWHYPADQVTNIPQRLWSAEITREQLYHQLHDEMPYETMVETEAWEEFNNGSVKVNQVIYVVRESQKAIVLGKGGQRVKAISSAARQELSDLLGRPVHLFLYVKVLEDWLNKREPYRMMGLEFES